MKAHFPTAATVWWLCLALLRGCAAGAGLTLPRCVVDSTSRQLSTQICEATGDCAALTRAWCAQQCRLRNLTVCGVEAGHQCLGGAALARPDAVAPDGDCNLLCTGNASETCGGAWRLWAFDPRGVPPPLPPPAAPTQDPRHVLNGRVLREGGYSCQPYCAVLPGDVWSCAMTFIAAPTTAEGGPGEHMVGMRTADQGRSWSAGFVDLEPYDNATTGQVSAYGSPVARADGSRVFALWVQNVNNVSHLPGKPPQPSSFRADMLGEFVWKYSDDGGRTWSDRHYPIPVPRGYIESVNSFSAAHGGVGNETDTQIMWQVDHVKVLSDSTALFAFTKIGTYPIGAPEEMHVMASPNLLSATDPEDVKWRIYPEPNRTDGHGIGPASMGKPLDQVIAEEPHVVPIANETVLYITFRTNQGYMGAAQSRPGAFEAAWNPSGFAEYAGPDWARDVENASLVKHPRGPMSPKFDAKRGMWFMTYYNTAPLGAFASQTPVSERNNMWFTVGRETNGTLRWSQPELVLYDRARGKGHSYADVLFDSAGSVYITETYKGAGGADARTHAVADSLVDGLASQATVARVARDGIVAAFGPGGTGTAVPLPEGALPDFSQYPAPRYGLTIDAWITSASPSNGGGGGGGGDSVRTLLDASVAADPAGGGGWCGARLTQCLQNGTVALELRDGAGLRAAWQTGPVCSARLAAAPGRQPQEQPQPHHVGVVADGGPKMILFVVDGKLCDGGPNLTHWPKGFGMFLPELRSTAGAVSATVGEGVLQGRLYNRSLYVSELIGNGRVPPSLR